MDRDTPYYAPIGEMLYDQDDDRVQCHLCGGWFRAVAGSHLSRAHGWSVEEYRETFKLLETQPTCAKGLSSRRRESARRRIADGEPPVGSRVSAQTMQAVYAQRRFPRWRSLAARHPEVSSQLHPTRNGAIDPFAIAARSHRKLWWRCEKGHEWFTSIYNRTAGTQCPICSRERPRRARAKLTLAERAPELLDQVHPTLNEDLDPAAVRAGSHRKIWWRCAYGHEWEAEVQSRVRGAGCPWCRLSTTSRRAALRREIATNQPTRSGV